jgi:hypothetical protein
VKYANGQLAQTHACMHNVTDARIWKIEWSGECNFTNRD